MSIIGFKFNPFKSLTLGGALSVIGGTLWSHFDPAAATGTAGPLVVQLVGLLLGMVGIRNAIAKNGTGA